MFEEDLEQQKKGKKRNEVKWTRKQIRKAELQVVWETYEAIF